MVRASAGMLLGRQGGGEQPGMTTTIARDGWEGVLLAGRGQLGGFGGFWVLVLKVLEVFIEPLNFSIFV